MSALPYEPCQPRHGSCALMSGHKGPHHGYPEDIAPIIAEGVRKFVAWVAINRAFNGSNHDHGQSLYNECLNAALPTWAEEWLA